MIITAFLKVNNRAYDDYDARISRSNIQITIFDFNFLISSDTMSIPHLFAYFFC